MRMRARILRFFAATRIAIAAAAGGDVKSSPRVSRQTRPSRYCS
jgi:hypothetical protein